ncbi:MAG: Bax inhibitor-1/YccA family protein [Rhizobiaceae bacterium]
MADYRENQVNYGSASRSGVVYDEGLRSYMLGIYNYMALALGVTGVAAMGTAYLASTSQAFLAAVYTPPLSYVIMFAPLAFVLVLSFGINKLSTPIAQLLFWAFAAIMGVSISSIFFVYTAASIVQTFFITAAAFGSLSLYGYTTKRNLSGMGSFLLMGLVGLILASIGNIFFQSGALQFAINVIGVLIFAGLTVYDTQRLKNQYDMIAGNTAVMARATIMGALGLYLNFINMFMFLLQFLGNRE